MILGPFPDIPGVPPQPEFFGLPPPTLGVAYSNEDVSSISQVFLAFKGLSLWKSTGYALCDPPKNDCPPFNFDKPVQTDKRAG